MSTRCIGSNRTAAKYNDCEKAQSNDVLDDSPLQVVISPRYGF